MPSQRQPLGISFTRFFFPSLRVLFGTFLFWTPAQVFPQPVPTPPTLQCQGVPLSTDQVLSRYIQIPSISGDERRAGAFFRDLCAENGLFVQQMGEENGNFNFAASIRPLESHLPNLVFLNHIDVVPSGDSSLWEVPPFSGAVVNQEIWGRGAYDNKGVAVMHLATLLRAQKACLGKDIPFNVTLLAVSSEETQGNGVQHVVNHFLETLNPALVIGEGAPGLKGVLLTRPDTRVFPISVANKRAFWLQLETKVPTHSHGSVTPDQYANKELVQALARLTEKPQPAVFFDLNRNILKQLGKMEKGIMGFALRHPGVFKPLIITKLRNIPEVFALFSNTLTLTGLDAHNSVVNVIPQSATALLDCRLLPMTSQDEFLKEVRKRLGDDPLSISILEQKPPVIPSDENHPFYRLLEGAIREEFPEGEVITLLTPNYDDTAVFRERGVLAYTVVPFELDREYLEAVHGPNERVPCGKLDQGAWVLARFVQKCMEFSPGALLAE